MMTDTAELLRLMLNLIRMGTIADVDYAAQRVRVKMDGNTTNWRPWVTLRAGNAQTWWPPSVGEQVIVFSPEGDFNQSVVMPAVYSNAAHPPSANQNHHTTNYPDGTVIQYDSATHALSATLAAGSTVMVKADTVLMDATHTICTGNLVVKNNLSVNGLSSLNAGLAVLPGSNGAPATINGALHVTDNVTVQGISVTGHTHPVFAVGADTGAPT